MIAFPQEPQDEPDEPTPNDPSPDEITRRSKKIRRGWSESQRKRRSVHKEPTSWLPPFVIIARLSDELPPEQN